MTQEEEALESDGKMERMVINSETGEKICNVTILSPGKEHEANMQLTKARIL